VRGVPEKVLGHIQPQLSMVENLWVEEHDADPGLASSRWNLGISYKQVQPIVE